uniref:Uncharacterized protein n=1 Tax=Anguilla anguilla TaxID=7936 RepID=A0A0E9W0U1_ANGAN
MCWKIYLMYFIIFVLFSVLICRKSKYSGFYNI